MTKTYGKRMFPPTAFMDAFLLRSCRRFGHNRFFASKAGRMHRAISRFDGCHLHVGDGSTDYWTRSYRRLSG